MKLIPVTAAAAAALFTATLVYATDTNFRPGNMSGDAPAVEASKPRAERAVPEKKEPGFWEREAKRSGLDETGGGFKSKVTSLFHVPDWFQKQQDAYKARHPNEDR